MSINRTATDVVRHDLTSVHDNAPLEVVGDDEADVEVQAEINHENGACDRPSNTGSVVLPLHRHTCGKLQHSPP